VEPPATVDAVTDDMVLRRQQLPSADEWTAAVERAGALFGQHTSARVVTPRAVARFGQVADQVERLRTPALELVSVLQNYSRVLQLPHDDNPGRLATAIAASELLDRLHRASDPVALVSALAGAELDVPLVVLGRSISSSSQVADALRQADWRVIDRLAGLDGPEAESVRHTLHTAAAADENAAPLRDALGKARDRTLTLLVEPVPPRPPPSPPPPALPARSVRGRRDEALTRLREAMLSDALGENDRVEISYRVLGRGDDGRR